MNTIKFSHEYSKFFNFIRNGSTAMLMQALKTHHKELSREFIVYDTAILKGGYYPLPKTELLILLFRHELGVFTTIRRWTPEKERYYKSKVGEVFKVVISEEEVRG